VPSNPDQFTSEISYHPSRVIELFDEMARTYGAVNLLSSLGFSHLWRQTCVRSLQIEPHHLCADLMCGMGEAASLMLKIAGRSLHLDAVDFCPEMTNRCEKTIHRLEATTASVQTRNVFDLPSTPTYDRICCSFGLKTFDDGQLKRFAQLIGQLLRPGGRAAFVEIHVPKNRLLRPVYLFYIRHVIPFIGRLCLGDPNCYRHLALYTEDYARRDCFGDFLKNAGFDVQERFLFFGCARLYMAQRR
jgi:ubiquinone/menaquinone biosynthesis methyltransferase